MGNDLKIHKKTAIQIIALAFTLMSFPCLRSGASEKQLDLAGIWQFKIDTADVGIKERWFMSALEETVTLPGSMRDNDKGFKPSLTTNWTASIYDSSWYFNPALEQYRTEEPLKFPFWLTPNRHYVGAAWYQKTVSIPKDWSNRKVVIYLERPHWQTTIWIDTVEVSHQNSLSTPHSADITKYLKPGKNKITIRVDNRLNEVNVGPDSHSVTEHTQGNWNGIIGDIKLLAKSRVSIKQVDLFPNVAQHILTARVIISNPEKIEANAQLQCTIMPDQVDASVDPIQIKKQFDFSTTKDTIELTIDLGKNILLWDEFEPNLYRFDATLKTEDLPRDTFSSTFGMREITTSGKQILVNGNPVFMRGNVDCCVFPLTGYPPVDVDAWLKIFGKTKAYGFNHVRFHSWCPPEAAFEAADQLGIYLQVEGPSWANHGTDLGTGRSIDQYIYDESERIIAAYGNHPSFCMFAYGNEPRGNYVAYLNDFLKYWKAKDTRRIYTGASIGGSWKACDENQYQVKGGARGLPWKNRPGCDFNYEKEMAWSEVPFITHELGQYCVYPNFDEIPKYTGVYKAYNFELFRDLLRKNQMTDQANDFLLASGELQKICYKHEMEATLRTKGMAGYQMLQLNDFPGQGTSLVGLLDAFYDEKGYVTAKEFNQFCAPVTLLATLPKFIYTTAENFEAGIELANYGNKPVENKSVTWEIKNEAGKVVQSGKFKIRRFAIGEVNEIGRINFPLHAFPQAGKLTLECSVDTLLNHWDFWVYPNILPEEKNNVYITDTLDEKAISALQKGGDVLLLAAGKVENGKDVVQYFTPVFWNTSWFKMRPPHTTGALIQNNHPIFKDFPTNYHSDLQWWEILNRQQVMNLENFPPEFRPLVQPIDTWFLNRRLGLLFEARVSNGRIVICSADLTSDPENRPAARQLLYSIKKYMRSNDFQPKYDIKLSVVQELFEKKQRSSVDFYTKDSPDELKPDHAKNKN